MKLKIVKALQFVKWKINKPHHSEVPVMRPLSWRGKTVKVGYTNGVSCAGSSELRFSSKEKKWKKREENKNKVYNVNIFFFVGSGKTAAYFLFECGENGENDKEPKFFSVRFILFGIFVPQNGKNAVVFFFTWRDNESEWFVMFFRTGPVMLYLSGAHHWLVRQ